ncbi:MAG: hypothetical protein EKK40_13490 [Bradyrhizobiaceae bacterium]|nr:MAG: hypothetical protein EKK40_13490 [Bradyrhizobiaceae bacterium]
MRRSYSAIAACLFLGALVTPVIAGETSDTRELIQRTDAEKAFILEQMRLLLGSIAEVEDALGSGDMNKVADEAAARGRKANINLPRPPGLSAKESDGWKSMFQSVRGGFDLIAEKAKVHAPAAEINKTLADTMRNCVACHETYRITVEH